MSIPPEISKWLEQSQITPVECCGHGGYGEIWLVKAPFGQNWALKIIDKTKLEPSAWEREVRAVQKYRAAIGLELNLIYVQQAGDLDDYFFYLMNAASHSAKRRTASTAFSMASRSSTNMASSIATSSLPTSSSSTGNRNSATSGSSRNIAQPFHSQARRASARRRC